VKRALYVARLVYVHSRRPHSYRALRGKGLALAAALALAELAACTSGEQNERAAAGRTAVSASTPEGFAALLRADYAARSECIERTFPATISLAPGDTSRQARFQDEQHQRPFELLRDAGLVTREEVRPGDRDWRLPPSAWVDAGGTKRIVRYVLNERGRGDAEKETVAAGVVERLCYGRRRLLTVDSVVTRNPPPAWTLEDGVRYGDASAFVLHTVTVDDMTPWALELARRDTLRDVMPDPSVLEGPQKRWAAFTSRGGPWTLTSTNSLGPQH
jgi:hypothetical protein